MFNILKQNKILLSGILLVLINFSCTKNEIKLSSPDGKYVYQLNTEDQAKYSVEYSNNVIIAPSSIGFEIDDLGVIGQKLEIESVNYSSVDTSWNPVYGERNVYPEKYSQAVIHFKNDNSATPKISLKVRAYNEGVAFRYEFNTNKKLTINKELTEFVLPAKTETWVSARAQHQIYKTTVPELNEIVDRPVLAELPEDLYVAIGEASLVDFARMKISKSELNQNALQANITGKVITDGNFNTPWRTLMAGTSQAEILENNYLLLNLNEPNKIKNTDWIKPGNVIREVTLTTDGAKACIDFAAKHNIQYVEFDAGWYGPEHDSISDASTITVDPKRSKGPLDLHAIINYGNNNDVGIILYVNRRALEKQLDQILPLYQSWGIKGLKYGFVKVGTQEWTTWLHEAVRKAAEYELMVDIHDEYRPTGYSRTYPNLMTQEGIRGDETKPSTEHSLKTLFTRMLAGAGDNTNCFLTPRVHEEMGGKAAQFAKAIMIYSPWQFLYWYDRPEASPHNIGGAGSSATLIKESPELSFYDALPTVWDDTKVLEGKIGEYATIARRKGNKWFIGSLTANQDRALNIDLSFLNPNKKYKAIIYSQDNAGLKDNKVEIQEIVVPSEYVFKRELIKNSGIAIILSEE